MTAEDVRRLILLSRQLIEYLMSAALCAKEIAAIVQAESHPPRDDCTAASGRQHKSIQGVARPFMDESTLSVIWQGRAVHLGHTQGYWLLDHMLRRVNQYVTHVDLMEKLWEDEFADTSRLRAGVRRLRVKLQRGGMAKLARAITGHNGRYMLDLNSVSRHQDITEMSHRTSSG